MSNAPPEYSRQELAFFAEIVREPLDDTPRLIYADWLEDRGDPLGELIRVECELERVRVGEPRYYELEYRRHALASEFMPLWEQRLKELPVEFVGFDRGLVDQLIVAAGDFVACAGELFALCPWMSRLQLKDELLPFPPSPHWSRIASLSLQADEGAEGSLAELLRAGGFERLVNLELWDVRLSAEDTAALAGSHATAELQRLAIWRCNLDAGLLEPLMDGHAFDNLRDLRLGMTESFADEAAAMLAGWKALGNVDQLHLDEANIKAKGAQALAASPYAGRLAELSMNENPIGNAGAAALLTSPNLANLKDLDLCNCRISDGGLKALATAPGPARFASLSMRFNRIGDKGAAYLAQSPQLAECRSLEVGDKLGPAGARSLADSRQLVNLRDLALAGNDLGNEGAAALAAGSALRSVVDLFLDECKIGPEGVSALVNAPFAENLARLSLHDNPVGDEGAEALAASRRLTRLASLSLWDAEIHDRGAEALAAALHLDSLQELELVFNPITKVGARAFTTTPHLPRLITLWLPDAESERELKQRERLLRERFGPNIDLGEADVMEDSLLLPEDEDDDEDEEEEYGLYFEE